MARYIDADRIDWRLIIPTNATTAEENMIYQARKLVEFQPTADVVEVVRGEWIDGYKRQSCSVCHFRGMRSWNFCPHCGADMRGGTE